MLSRDDFSEHAEHISSLDMGPRMSRARWLLASKIEKTLDEKSVVSAGGEVSPFVKRVSVKVEGALEMSPLSWLGAQNMTPKSYWAGREGNSPRTAAIGIADIVCDETDEAQAVSGVSGERDLSRVVAREISPVLGRSDAGVRYFGGARFDAGGEISGEWAAFGGYRFVLPRFELVQDEDGCSLVCNLVMPRDIGRRDDILSDLREMASPEAGVPKPAFVSRTDEPGYAGWSDNINHALSAFAEGEVGKVVMARRATISFDSDVDAIAITRSLYDATPGCFHFYFEPEAGEAFIGASPERLYSRDGRAVRSEAVAGTRPRGDSSPDDEDLREELLGSDKDRAEHRFVKESIGEDLRPLCEALKVEEGVSEMKLASRRHLVSRVRGTLRDDVTDAEILGVLHPTPAVGGYPKEAAKQGIRELETFDRGWYAGPVGWISSDGAEFAVGIRSGLARGSELALYSGAGIVPGSTPEAEWDEIEQKISDFLGVLGLDRMLDDSRQHATH